MRTYVVIVNADNDAIPGGGLAAAVAQGYGDDYILAYLRTKMPAGSPVSIVAAYDAQVETILTDGEMSRLVNRGTTAPARRDDDPAV